MQKMISSSEEEIRHVTRNDDDGSGGDDNDVDEAGDELHRPLVGRIGSSLMQH